MADTTDLAALRDLINSNTAAGEQAREALGLRWERNRDRRMPGRRLVSNFAPITEARWRRMHDAETSG